MDMLPYDFKQPLTFINTLAQFSLALECAMVALRDEAEFHEEGDHAMVNAAHQFSAMLEDAHKLSVDLANRLEERVLSSLSS